MIDTMMFAVDVAADTYTAGQVLPMSVVRGPSVVRDGYGKAIMKKTIVLSTYSSICAGTYVTVKNANWNDSMATFPTTANGNQALTLLSTISPAVQKTGDVELQPNSSFEVNLVIGEAVTTTSQTSVICLIDIDYPSVQAVANPREETGMPVSIIRGDTMTAVNHGNATALVWTTVNVDEFKAGYRYLLAQVGAFNDVDLVGFVAFSGAASMNGLVRIIPVMPKYVGSSRLELDYSTPMVKGPMNIEYAAIGTAGSRVMYLECDYIRR